MASEGKGEGAPSLARKVIYLVGTARLQNSLLALVLQQTTGASCKSIKGLNDIPELDPGGEDQTRLVLCDCGGKDPEIFLAEFSANRSKVRSSDLVALFNVPRGLEIRGKALALDIRGLFYEEDGATEIQKGIQAIFNQQIWLSGEDQAKEPRERQSKDANSKGTGPTLTPQEKKILRMVASGATNNEIAKKIHVSPHTVKAHLYIIFRKISVTSRLQAGIWANSKNL